MQDRIRHRTDQAQLERAPLLVRVINGIPDLLAHRPLDGIGVADGRDLGYLRLAIGDIRFAIVEEFPALAEVEALGHTREGDPAG